jgi:nucleotide-binding universal stress UspA family protein
MSQENVEVVRAGFAAWNAADMGSIVVGTDGSETASVAVMRAGALATTLGASVHLVCAFKTVAVRAGRTPQRGAYDEARNGALAVLDDAARDLQDSGVRVENHAILGDPAEALLQIAEANRARLIVVGSKGMSGARRYLLGSVPDKVSHHASCSVLIVRNT